MDIKGLVRDLQKETGFRLVQAVTRKGTTWKHQLPPQSILGVLVFTRRPFMELEIRFEDKKVAFWSPSGKVPSQALYLNVLEILQRHLGLEEDSGWSVEIE